MRLWTRNGHDWSDRFPLITEAALRNRNSSFVVLAPTTVKPTPGPREDTISPERVREIFWNDIRFISAINVLGLPGAVVPVVLHEGRPIGVQLIAGRYREDLALDAAAAIEKRAGTLVRQLWERMS